MQTSATTSASTETATTWVTTASVSGSDPFLPPPFSANANEDYDNFIKQFEHFANFRRLDETAQLHLMPLLLK